MRSLETVPPLVVESAGVVTPPGPSHWKSGVPVTPSGRVTEQVREKDSPATTEEGEEVRTMVAGSRENYIFKPMTTAVYIYTLCIYIPIVTSCGTAVSVLGSVPEVEATLIE